MINVASDRGLNVVQFYRIIAVFLPRNTLQEFKYFGIQNREKLGHIRVHFDMSPINLNFILPKHITHIVLNHFTQAVYALFLMLRYPQAKILTTGLTLELSRIYLEQLQSYIEKTDACIQKLEFVEESEIFDKYTYIQPVFSSADVQNLIKKATVLKYGQIYDTEDGVSLVPQPNGGGVGSASWCFTSITTKESLLVLKDLSILPWAIQAPLNSQVFKDIDKILLLQGCLKTSLPSHQQLLNTVRQVLSQNTSVTVVVSVQTEILNFLAAFYNDLSPICRQFHILNNNYWQYVNYCNSFVDYLSPYYRHQIFKDPPVQPLDLYFRLQTEKYLRMGSLNVIADQQRIPVKQLLLRSNPCLNFINQPFFTLGEPVTGKIFHYSDQIGLSVAEFKQLLQQIGPKQIYSIYSAEKLSTFCENRRVIVLKEGMIHQISEMPEQQFITCINFRDWKTQGYQIQNGSLQMNLSQENFRLLPRKWTIALAAQMESHGIKVEGRGSQWIQSNSSYIRFANWRLNISSSSQNEVNLIVQILKKWLKTIKLDSISAEQSATK